MCYHSTSIRNTVTSPAIINLLLFLNLNAGVLPFFRWDFQYELGSFKNIGDSVARWLINYLATFLWMAIQTRPDTRHTSGWSPRNRHVAGGLPS